MTDNAQHPIPSTFEMLQRTMRPKIVSRFERVENYLLGALFCLALLVLGTWGLSAMNWINLAAAKFALAFIVVTMVVVVAVWGTTQIIEGIGAWRAGYHPIAERIDSAIIREGEILSELEKCNPQELRERSQHLELEAKVLGRRAGLFTVTGAIAVVLINISDAAEKAKIWPELSQAKIFVYTGSLGILIGSLLLVIFVGKLERISGLFALAANRRKKIEKIR